MEASLTEAVIPPLSQGGGETEGAGETAERAGETGEREEGTGGCRDEEKGGYIT